MAMVEVENFASFHTIKSELEEIVVTQGVNATSITKPLIHLKSMPAPLKIKHKVFDAVTSIGLRPSQEDRMLVIPELFSPDVAVAAVFDGTVGHHASDFASKHFLSHLYAQKPMQEILGRHSHGPSSISVEDAAQKIRSALLSAFLSLDTSLLVMCNQERLHYASSTAVVGFMWHNLLTLAHVGDSKACIAKMNGSVVVPEWLTVDHKPNQTSELRRIEQNGGSLVWLHGSKPFIRGGDFLRRQSNGEHPKQLNYSRAFGGKDLKPYGLSAEPDINHFEIDPDDRIVLIASDGLWDVLSPRVACEIALAAHKRGDSPCQAVVDYAIQQMPSVGVRDNITVLAIIVNDEVN